MPRPMLKQPQTQMQIGGILSATAQQSQKQPVQQMDKMRLDRLLRKKRSKEYMDALHKLDAGGHVHNQHKVNEIIDAIRNEFPEVELKGMLLGVVSTCYLGKPYEVHTLDITGQIIEHYKRGETLHGGLEKAHALALHGTYDFVEVYIDRCICVSSNGSTSVIT